MTIVFDTMPIRGPRRVVSAPTTSSLLNRIQKPPLAERLSTDDSTPRSSNGPCVHPVISSHSRANSEHSGPVRTRQPRRGPRSEGKPAARQGPKKPKTAEELDKELDAFMVDTEPAAAPAAPPAEVAPAVAVAATPVQDVEMA